MILVAIGICWVVGVVRTGLQYTTALRTGQCRIVEGTVEVLETEGKTRPESIRIGAEELSYSYKPSFSYEGINYHWGIREGGPLTNGAYARLHIFDGDILKVEMKR